MLLFFRSGASAALSINCNRHEVLYTRTYKYSNVMVTIFSEMLLVMFKYRSKTDHDPGTANGLYMISIYYPLALLVGL